MRFGKMKFDSNGTCQPLVNYDANNDLETFSLPFFCGMSFLVSP